MRGGESSACLKSNCCVMHRRRLPLQYIRRSLYWMQQRECETELFDLTLHRVRVDPLALAAWTSPYHMLLLTWKA